MKPSAPTCAWTAASNATWLAITAPASGVGSGTIRYTLTANATHENRTATVTVGNASHVVTQAGAPVVPCTYSVEPGRIEVPSGASTARVSLTTTSECPWEAVSDVSWIAVTSAASGVGPAAIDLSVEANRRETPRTGTVTVAGQRVEVGQAGEEQPAACDYSVAPVEFSPCMPGGTLVTRITTGDRCTWTVSSNASWLTVLSGASGSGSADIRAEFSSNYDLPRHGLLLVRWPSPTAGQNVQVNQAGCRYGVSRSRIDVVAGGGNATFDVVQQSDPILCGGATQDRCTWSAVADVGWITITTSMPRTGDDRVSFTAAANPTGQTRTGHITVRDQHVEVVQAGQ